MQAWEKHAMRANIPTPVVIAILVVVLIGLVAFFWKASAPQTAGNEDLIRAAFGAKGTKAPKIPPPPGGGPGGVGPGSAPVPPPGVK
jgi:uncharacterized membrane protein YqiK